MVQETENSKNLYVQPMDMNGGGECWRAGGCRVERDKREKIGKTVIA